MSFPKVADFEPNVGFKRFESFMAEEVFDLPDVSAATTQHVGAGAAEDINGARSANSDTSPTGGANVWLPQTIGRLSPTAATASFNRSTTSTLTAPATWSKTPSPVSNPPAVSPLATIKLSPASPLSSPSPASSSGYETELFYQTRPKVVCFSTYQTSLRLDPGLRAFIQTARAENNAINLRTSCGD